MINAVLDIPSRYIIQLGNCSSINQAQTRALIENHTCNSYHFIHLFPNIYTRYLQLPATRNNSVRKVFAIVLLQTKSPFAKCRHAAPKASSCAQFPQQYIARQAEALFARACNTRKHTLQSAAAAPAAAAVSKEGRKEGSIYTKSARA